MQQCVYAVRSRESTNWWPRSDWRRCPANRIAVFAGRRQYPRLPQCIRVRARFLQPVGTASARERASYNSWKRAKPKPNGPAASLPGVGKKLRELVGILHLFFDLQKIRDEIHNSSWQQDNCQAEYGQHEEAAVPFPAGDSSHNNPSLVCNYVRFLCERISAQPGPITANGASQARGP
jgi:hypothetical protein